MERLNARIRKERKAEKSDHQKKERPETENRSGKDTSD